MIRRSLPTTLTLLALAVALAAQEGAAQEASCITCHGAEARLYRGTIHAVAGVDCVTCHGGDPGSLTVEGAHAGSFSSLTEPLVAVEACGSCHADAEVMRGYGLRTDPLQVYWTSHHGRALAEDGNEDVATCVTCHAAHAVRPATDPRSPAHKFRQTETCGSCHSDAARMEPYGLSATVTDEFRGSVHGRALIEESRLSSPACTDCHGSHGATPPRVAVVGRVCGNCHSVEQQYFEESPHMAAVQDGSMQECIDCHGSHAVGHPSEEVFAAPESSSCGLCHEADSTAIAVAHELGDGLRVLAESIAEAEQELRLAGSRGLFLEEEFGYLADARSLRSRARALTHTLSPAAMAEVLNRGHAAVDQTYASLAVKQRGLRDRMIFAVVLLLVNLLLALVLQTYRREVYGKTRRRVET